MNFSRSDNPPPTPEDERWARPPQRVALPTAEMLRRDKDRELVLYSVPRRFDIATLLTVSFAYSLLFTLLRQLGAEWPTFAYFGGLSVVVGVAQAMFPYGNQPRWASALAGMGYSLLWCIGLGIIYGFLESDLICAMFAAVVVGPMIGYLSGACEAGVFLVADMVRRICFPDPILDRETEVQPAEPLD